MVKKFSFAGNTAIYALSNFAVAGVPFFLLPILTRILSAEDYGIVAMFTLAVSLFFVIVGLNTHGAVMIRYFDRERFAIAPYVTTVLLILLLTTAIAAAVVFVFGNYLHAITKIPVGWLLIAVVVAAFQFLAQTLLALWQASKQPVKYGALRFNHAMVEGVLSILLVAGLHLAWTGRLLGIGLAWAVTASVAAWFLYREGWVAGRGDKTYASDALRYGIPLAPHAVGGLMLGLADRFMVTNLLDLSSTGIYLAAAQIGMALGITVDAINKAFAPWLMETLHSATHAKKAEIVRNTYLYFCALIAAAAAAGVVAPYILPFIVGEQFAGAGEFIIFLFFGNAFIGMYYMVTNYIFFASRTELLSALTISVGSVSVVLSWFLIKTYGLKGAAIGFMIGQALLFLGAWCLAHFCHPMPWFGYRRARAEVQ